tara:strand:- start:393 stop:725 length:333 start_codon:yes stop_codon:yes gene_type:complete
LEPRPGVARANNQQHFLPTVPGISLPSVVVLSGNRLLASACELRGRPVLGSSSQFEKPPTLWRPPEGALERGNHWKSDSSGPDGFKVDVGTPIAFGGREKTDSGVRLCDR